VLPYSVAHPGVAQALLYVVVLSIFVFAGRPLALLIRLASRVVLVPVIASVA
jgi:uncharacterized protein YqhQ